MSEVDIMIFSEKLNLLRKTKGYTQEELAEKLCVSRQAIAKWESGD
jgi:transcriptional regulator with XRE-family HTH domain